MTFGPWIDGIGTIGALRAMAMDEDTIGQIAKMLDERATQLDEKRPTEVARGDFGGSWWGGEFGRHAEKAQANVIDAIVQMVAGLQGFRESLDEHKKDTRQTDEGQAAAMRPIETMIEEAAACTTGDDLTTSTVSSNACTPAAGS